MIILKFKNRKGYALAVLIIVVAIVIILGTTLLVLSVNEMNFSIREENRIQAYYVAKAGILGVEAQFNEPDFQVDQVADLVNSPQNRSNSSVFSIIDDEKRFRVFFTGDEYQPIIHSIGSFKTSEQGLNLSLTKTTYFDSAILVAGGNFEFDSGGEINGDVTFANGATLNDSAAPAPGPYPNITGEIKPPLNISFPTPAPPDDAEDFSAAYSNDLDDLLDPGLYDPVDDEYFIDVGDSRTIYIENIEMNNEDVYVVGNSAISSVLHLYCDTISFKGNWYAQNCKVIVYIINSGDIEDSIKTGSSVFQASIYAPTATVVIKANMEVYGSVVAENPRVDANGLVDYQLSPGERPPYPEDMGFPSLGYRQGGADNIAWRKE